MSSQHNFDITATRILLLIGLILIVLFNIAIPFKSFDFHQYISWHFDLTKIHLATELKMPYITPGRSGGFLLAADAQGFIFSLYMLVSFLIPNVVWAVKITNIFLTVSLALGVYQWLAEIYPLNRLSRMLAGILVSLSGHWFFHIIEHGQIFAHAFAYTPWVLLYIERILKHEGEGKEKKIVLLKNAALLTFFSFLLINAGYYWFLYMPPLIGFRLLVELISRRKDPKNFFRLLGWICAAGLAAIFLSWPRLGAVYAFQLSKYPRLGEGMPHYQVIGEMKALLDTYFHSFFNGTWARNGTWSNSLGGIHEYCNFIGKFSLIAIGLSLLSGRVLSKSKMFWGLFLASLFQITLTRTTHLAELLRTIIPLYKQTTYYWRGSPTLILLAGVLVAFGLNFLTQHPRNKIFLLIGIIIIASILSELFLTYRVWMDFSKVTPVHEILNHNDPPEKPMTKHYRPCCNLAHIFGNNWIESNPPQISIVANNSVYDSPKPDFFNVHDVRQLFAPEAENGYYVKNPWPLWPKSDRDEFEKFINYRQIVRLPLSFRLINYLSGLFGIIYTVFCSWLFLHRTAANQNEICYHK